MNRLANEVAPGKTVRHARPVRVPVLDDVPGVAESPAVGARRPAGRRGAQPDRRAGSHQALGAGGARSDVRPFSNRLPDKVRQLHQGRRAVAAGLCPAVSTASIDIFKENPHHAAYELPPLPYAHNALEPHIDDADDADPPREASPGLRQQPQRRARQAPGAAGQADRAS